MGEIVITVSGRPYRFACEDGEEARLNELAAYVKSRLDSLKREHGNVGDERLLLMTALMITDELWDATSGEEKAETRPAADAKLSA
jgi:cell division protein ZapA